MSWKLTPVAQRGWAHTYALTVHVDTTPLFLGRGPDLGIEAHETAVSRKHCEVAIAERGGLEVRPLKRVWLIRCGSKEAELCSKRTTTELEAGDVVYLAKNVAGNLQYGFLVAELGEEGSDAVRKRKRAENEKQEPTSAAKQQKVGEEQEKGSNDVRFLAGQRFVFWARTHMKIAIERARAAGAEIMDSWESTSDPGLMTHVVTSPNTTAAEMAGKLGQETFDLPAGVEFVNPDFVPACLAEKRMLSPVRFRVLAQRKFLEEQKRQENEARKPPTREQGGSDSKDEGASKSALRAELNAAAAPRREEGLEDRPPNPTQVTGGDSGLPWGAAGHWIEPWKLEHVKATLHRLDQHWHRQDLGAHPSSSKPGGAGGHSDFDVSSSESEAGRPDGTGETPPKACRHVACSKCRGCIIKELKLLISQYDRSGTDQYRRRAAERAVRRVSEHQKPLGTLQDVEGLQLGKESTTKIAQIVENGSLARNDAFLADPKAQTITLFASVWGAAKRTAEKWFHEGSRSLEDVQRRSDLTEQQAAGLRYFEDMRVRIPRAEATKIANAVRAAALRLFGWTVEGADAAHVRPMGSFLRGKPATTDVDMLILPPASETRFPPELMRALLANLQAQGMVTDDMHPQRSKSLKDQSCTFLGFCRLPGNPLARRLDIKIYPRWTLPFAVNYFTGSGSFNRALRYWATTAPVAAEAARKLAASSTGFKLSDVGLLPIRKSGTGSDRVEEATAPPVDGIQCETDIFKILGLSYVPPHMRYFHDFQ